MRSITYRQFLEWEIFFDLEPDDAERADWNAAHIVQSLISSGKPLREYMLPFGDYVVASAVVQHIAYQEMLIDTWIAGSNALHSAKVTKVG